MTTPQFTVLTGGRALPVSQMEHTFLSAYVTDTRLMGVLAICARWNIIAPGANRADPDSWEDLHQFFYIDCEETGLETYQQVRGSDQEKVQDLEQAMTGGLGAENIDLTERQLRQLLAVWKEFNEIHGLPMPAGEGNYSFLFAPALTVSKPQRYQLMQLTCAPISTDYQLINYFLMRCFGRDYEGAAYLTRRAKATCTEAADLPPAEDFPLDIYDKYERATFCRNAIDENKVYGDGAREYLCESLVEMDGAYDSIISKVVVKDLQVIGFEHCSSFPISDTEAAMMLKKPEYVTLCEVFLSPSDMENNLDEFTRGLHTTMSECENGRLFMQFRQNNNHVDSRLFQLSNDVAGLYFLTENNQLLLCAYSPRDIYQLEYSIHTSMLRPYIVPSARYEFLEPVLYEFMQSDIDHFEDFLSLIRDGR